MPLFSTVRFGAQTVEPGDTFTLFAAADTLIAGSQSPVFSPHAPGVPRGIVTFKGDFASAATAVYKIFGSNTPPTAAGPDPNPVTLYTSTNTQHDNYTDNVGYAFYWAQLVSQSGGGALTLVGHAN